MIDVAVVGAGFAGTLLAHNLRCRGIAVTVLDRSEHYPDVLRAEKIEPEQAECLRRLGALEYRVPLAPPLGTTVNYREGSREAFDTIEQYGIAYHNTVNSMRAQMLRDVPLQIDEATAIVNGKDTQEVHTRSGRIYRSRLVVISTGGSNKLLHSLGLRRRVIPSLRSLTLGFDVQSHAAPGFDFSGFNYFLERNPAGIDYLTLFRVGDRMRANLFTQWEPRSAFLKRMSTHTREMLLEHFPDLETQIGSFDIAGKVQFFKTGFYRLGSPVASGVVVIGDEYQSVCPATGTGLTKVTTDVDVLANDCVPRWLASPGMGRDKIAEFYGSAQKVATDDDSLERWRHYRDRLAPRWKVHWYRVEHRLWGLRE